jgi:hypothetical protein
MCIPHVIGLQRLSVEPLPQKVVRYHFIGRAVARSTEMWPAVAVVRFHPDAQRKRYLARRVLAFVLLPPIDAVTTVIIPALQ